MPVKVKSNKPAILLPTERVEPTGMPKAAKVLIVAPPGWGKTEFAASNPNCLQLLCQEGHAGVGGYKVRIISWDGDEEPYIAPDDIPCMSFVQCVKQLREMNPLPYNFMSVDTIDDLVKMLVDEKMPTLKKDGRAIQHLSDLEYGKGYDMGQNSPFRKEFQKLTKLGLGIIFITHEDTTEKSFGKEKRAKKETTLPTGIYKQIFPIVESVLHGVFGKRRKGTERRDRIIVTEGSETMLAKNRYGALPAAWIVNPDITKRWKEFVSFWNSDEKKKAAFEQFINAGYDLESF